MELQDSRSEIAKLVWAKLAYTECVVSGENTTIIEIKDVWVLISEIEKLFNTTKDALDFNVKQNIGLIKENHKLHEERGQNVSEQHSNCNKTAVINCGYTEIVKAVENGLHGEREQTKRYVQQYIDKYPNGLYASPFLDLVNNNPRRLKLE